MRRDLMWAQVDQPGLEHLQLIEDGDGSGVGSVVIGIIDNTPFHLRYQIYCDANWTVHEVALQSSEGSGLNLQSDGKGRWTTGAGALLPALDGCIDVDIRATPFTNTLPIRRLALKPGQSAEILVAYIKVPDLEFMPKSQRYTCLDPQLYRYESLDSGYTADLKVDADGLVLEYPEAWRRVWPV
jgi:uncharacterized protein